MVQDDLLRTREQRLDRAIAAVAHPAFEAVLERGHFGPGAKADALHAAADDDDDSHVHPNSPSLRTPEPIGFTGSHCCKEAT